MWKKAKDNLDAGVEKVKWFSTLVNDRMKVELSLARLLYTSHELEKKRRELLTTIGDRVYELRNGPEKHVLRDPEIIEATRALEALDAELDGLKKQAAEISKIET
jgi:hypothetical protein